MDGVAGTHTSHAHGGENDSPGIEKPGGRIGEQNRILSLYEANQNRGADSFLHLDPVGALIHFFALGDKRGIYLFRLIALAHFE